MLQKGQNKVLRSDKISGVLYVSTAGLLTSQPARMAHEASGPCILSWARLSAPCSRWCSIWPVYLVRRHRSRSVGFRAVWACTCCVWMLIIPADPNRITASRTAATRALFIRLPHFTILKGRGLVCSENVKGVFALVPVLCREAGDLTSECRCQAFLSWHEKQKSWWVTISSFPPLNQV